MEEFVVVALIVFVLVFIISVSTNSSSKSTISKETEQQLQARRQREQIERERQAAVERQQRQYKEQELARKRQQQLLEQEEADAKQAQEVSLKYQQHLAEQQRIEVEQARIAEQRRLAIKRQEEKLQQQREEEEQHQQSFCEANTPYCSNLKIHFDVIKREFSFAAIRSFSQNCDVWGELDNGVAQLNTSEQLSQYLFSYGLMHQAKLKEAFSAVFLNNHLVLNGQGIEIIDYGCGQGLGTVCFLDFIKTQANRNFRIDKVKLIEPSELALKRGALHVRYALRSAGQVESVFAIHKELDDVTQADLLTGKVSVKVHIFSNILDVEDFDIGDLHQKIVSTQEGVNLFVCVSPKIMQSRNERLDYFQSCFKGNGHLTVISSRENDIPNPSPSGKPWSRYERVFKVQLGQQANGSSNNVNLAQVTRFNEDNDLPF